MERGEFISYVEREQAHLRRFLLALCCGNADEADDIAQDALVKAYLSSSSYNDEGKFGVWICKIAYNTFLDRKRASKQSDTLDEATLVQDDTFAADIEDADFPSRKEIFGPENVYRLEFENFVHRHGASGNHSVMHRIDDIDFIRRENLLYKIIFPQLGGVVMFDILRMSRIPDFAVYFHNNLSLNRFQSTW